MNHIISYIAFAIMALVGGTTSLYLIISLPAVIIWKIYRCIKYGCKFTD